MVWVGRGKRRVVAVGQLIARAINVLLTRAPRRDAAGGEVSLAAAWANELWTFARSSLVFPAPLSPSLVGGTRYFI